MYSDYPKLEWPVFARGRFTISLCWQASTKWKGILCILSLRNFLWEIILKYDIRGIWDIVWIRMLYVVKVFLGGKSLKSIILDSSTGLVKSLRKLKTMTNKIFKLNYYIPKLSSDLQTIVVNYILTLSKLKTKYFELYIFFHYSLSNYMKPGDIRY